MKKKVLIIGLDGATFDVIDPLAEKGFLPNIKKLKEAGAHGEMKSTIPPITGPAWVAMATGKNPGKTGVFDFLNSDQDGKIRAVSSCDFEGIAYWDYLARAGYKVGLLNYPVLYPPYKINGFMVSGMIASIEDEICYPASLRKELDKAVGDYEIMIYFNKARYLDREDIFIKDTERLIKKRVKAAKYLIKNKDWDLFNITFSATDAICHYLWKYWDEDSFLKNKNPRKHFFRKSFFDLWTKVDEGIGEIIKLVPKETTVFIVSDHGFGSQKGLFFPNSWLASQGYLKRKSSGDVSLQKKKIKDVGKRMAKFIDARLETDLKSFFARFVKKEKITSVCDMENSIAYAGEYSNNIVGIHVKKTENEENIIKKIINDLEGFSAKRKIKINYWKKEEIYSGDYAGGFPDLILSVNNFSCGIIVNKIGKDFYIEDGGISKSVSGSHRLNGIFIASGNSIKSGKIEANIIDLAPTLLYFTEQNIPRDIDGRILKEIFEDNFINREQKESSFKVSFPDRESETKDKNNRLEQTKKRLEDLGYL